MGWADKFQIKFTIWWNLTSKNLWKEKQSSFWGKNVDLFLLQVFILKADWSQKSLFEKCAKLLSWTVKPKEKKLKIVIWHMKDGAKVETFLKFYAISEK